MGRKALVADDDPLMRRLCLGILELAGWQVITANNGREALELATRESPQLIIMDVVMAEMNGLEALRQLKKAEPTKAIPVIMISGNVERPAEDEFTASGAVAFLSKPFRPAELLEAIRPLFPEPAAKETAKPAQ